MNDQNDKTDAHRLITDLIAKLGDVDAAFETLRSQRQQCDLRVSRIYHEIEQTTFSSVAGYKLARKLQIALRERRHVKTNFEIVQSMKNTIQAAKIPATFQRLQRVADGRMASLAEYTEGWR